MKHVLELNDRTSINDLIKAVDSGGVGFVAVVDCERQLLGVVADGDLRRAMLNTTEDINQVMNRCPRTMQFGCSQEAIIAKLKKIHRRHMPIVDNNNCLQSVFVLDELEFSIRENTVVVMAGGLGSRLGKLTENTPKPMLNVGSKPILLRVIEQFRDQGFNKFIFCLNYKYEMIMEYFGKGNRFGVEIEYIIERKRMGTAGALSLIESIPDEPFFVINADVLVNLDFEEFLQNHNSSNAKASMCVFEHSYTVPYGVIRTSDEGKICSIEEKPVETYNVNAGIYILEPDVLRYLPLNKYFDMPDLFSAIISDSFDAQTYKLRDYWIDVGLVEQLEKANNDIRD